VLARDGRDQGRSHKSWQQMACSNAPWLAPGILEKIT